MLLQHFEVHRMCPSRATMCRTISWLMERLTVVNVAGDGNCQICLEYSRSIPLSGVYRFSKNVKDHLVVLGARRITWCKFHSSGSQNIRSHRTKFSRPGDRDFCPLALRCNKYYRILVKIVHLPTLVLLNSSILLQFLLASDRTFGCSFKWYIYGNGNCYKSYFYFIKNAILVNYEVSTAVER